MNHGGREEGRGGGGGGEEGRWGGGGRVGGVVVGVFS